MKEWEIADISLIGERLDGIINGICTFEVSSWGDLHRKHVPQGKGQDQKVDEDVLLYCLYERENLPCMMTLTIQHDLYENQPLKKMK